MRKTISVRLFIFLKRIVCLNMCNLRVEKGVFIMNDKILY